MADPTSIHHFKAITGSDEATASFFLSAADGDCDAAVSAFFDAGGVIPSGGSSSTNGTNSTTAPTVRNTSNTPSTRNRNRQAGGFATLSSLRNENDEEETNEEGNDANDEPQSYYTGGEKSGQIVQDPRKRDENESNESSIAERIFETARQRGSQVDQENGRFDQNQSFTGAGYRLGDQNRQPSNGPDVVGRRNVRRILTFFSNGFRVDEGPLRSYTDPANEEFLRDVNRGLVPKEMEQAGLGDVSITLVDKKQEEFEEKKERVPFTGDGQRLSNVASSSSTRLTTSEVDLDAANSSIEVDNNRPIANIQIRLSDGTRIVASLNEDHTIGDLRNFVIASRPTIRNFVLSTTFPRKVLDDDSKTIKDEQLKGAVVVQTLK